MFKDKWDQNATLTQNYKNLGLQLNLAPNMKHSKDGQNLLNSLNKDVRKKMLLDRAANVEGGEKILEDLQIDKHG